MTIFMLIVGVVLGLVIWYFMTAPKFVISLSTGGNTYEDAFIKVTFPFGNPENLRNLKQIPITLENKTTAPVKIDWDSSVFIDPAGKSNRVIHAGVKLTDRNSEQKPSVVASRSKFEDLMIPSDNIYWQEGTEKTAGGWRYRTLLADWASSETITFRTLLAITVGSESKSYELEFNGKKVVKAPPEKKPSKEPVPSDKESTLPSEGIGPEPAVQENVSLVAESEPSSRRETIAPPNLAAPKSSGSTQNGKSNFEPALSKPFSSITKVVSIVLIAILLLGGAGYWAWAQKMSAERATEQLAKNQAEVEKQRLEDEVQRRIKEAEERGRKEAEERAKVATEQRQSAGTEPQAQPQQQTVSDSLLSRASKCEDIKACIAMMLEAIDPRSPEALQVAATRIGELNRAQRGDRKVARGLNDRGLSEFKNKNFTAAVSLLKQANSADPADVEVLSNLGYVALQANRTEEAVTALSAALMLDPRRTSTWAPIAELYVIRGKNDHALRALLLGYEFSGNRDKTVTVYEERASSAEREAIKPIYVEALKKIALARNK
jgi:tetratricopeptide (TPR) repeat protein